MRRHLGLLLGVLLPLLTGSCTLVLDEPAEQCQRTSECVARGGTFAQSICNENRVCVPLASEDCTRVVGEVDEDAVLIGVMAALTSDEGPTGEARVRSIELALSELQSFSLGLPRSDGGKPRSLVLIECDQDANRDRAATHLMQTLKVPVLIGPAHTGDTLEVATQFSIPAGTLMINPSAAATSIAALQDNGLVWRTSSPDSTESYAISLYMPDLETAVRTEQKLSASDKIRVAVLAKTDAYGKGLAESAGSLVKFNGVVAQQNKDYFLTRQIPDSSADPNFDSTQVVSEVVAFKPDIVFLFGTTEMITKGMARIEATWPGETPRPRYVLTEGAKKSDLLTLIGNGTDATTKNLRQRIVGFEPRPNADLYGAFRLRYEATFGSFPDVYGMAGAYDAMYLLMYSLALLGDTPVSGASLASALTRMVPPGAPIDAGPKGFADAFAALQQGKGINYNGVVGPLDFDTKTGEAPADYDIWCVRRNPSQEPEFNSSGRYFSTSKNALQGTLSCP